MLKVHIIPILQDNYTYILEASNAVAIVDPGEAAPVIEYLDSHNLKPTLIFNTHHHGDHIAGNAEIIERYRCKLAGPKSEIGRIPNMDILLSEAEEFSFAGESIHILETPGHTRGHIALYFPSGKTLFTGDTLFSLGCGRLFEGDAQTMWNSLQKIMVLPDETQIYCGHEYTLSNGKFCLSIEPENAALQARMREVEILRVQNKPTLPVTLGTEKKTNVFLNAKTAENFGRLRALKDKF
jgi:hydroxyacylglutathione hydrolase